MIADFELDSSGEHMAALGVTDDRAGPRPLLIGRVGGDFDVVVTDSARGFAWHDTEPGQLAFVEGPKTGVGSLRVLDATSYDSEATEVAEVYGWLDHYGAWGFTTARVGSSPSFQMLDPYGATVVGTQEGAAVGFVPTVGMIATLTGAGHVAIDPWTGKSEPLPMFAAQDVLWHVSTGGPRGTFAVQATSADFADHNVLVFNRLSEVIARLPSAPLEQAMTWDTSGTKLIYTIDDSTDRTKIVVYDADTGTTTTSSFLEDPLYTRTIGIIVD